MASRIIVLADQRRSTSEESVGTRRDNNTFSFTLLAGRAAKLNR